MAELADVVRRHHDQHTAKKVSALGKAGVARAVGDDARAARYTLEAQGHAIAAEALADALREWTRRNVRGLRLAAAGSGQ